MIRCGLTEILRFYDVPDLAGNAYSCPFLVVLGIIGEWWSNVDHQRTRSDISDFLSESHFSQKSIKNWDHDADRQTHPCTDAQTHRHTDARKNGFIICPTLCSSYGTDNNK